MTDPIADMLVRIKNAQAAKKETASFGYSQMKWEIARILERAGYVKYIAKKGKKNRKLIEVSLVYAADGKPMISRARRISSPGRRVYRGFREIYSPYHGFGLAVYSTPRGLLTDREARKERVGGEILFEVS